jgi:glycerophosphoryl diester phosphodiesterase
MAAIRAAISLGVDLVEIDVQETLDGELVVFHDYRLDRIYGKHKRVRDARRAELPDAPTLADALCLKFPLLIEIKGADGAKVAREIKQHRRERDVIVFSIKPHRIREALTVLPNLAVFGLAANAGGLRRPPPQITGWGLSRRLIRSRADVTRFHRRGLRVFVWTVNRPAQMRQLLQWGVDGIITDHPDRARRCRACELKSGG